MAFEKDGTYGRAARGTVLIGNQFAAAASVIAGVKRCKETSLVSIGIVRWASALAKIMASLGTSKL